MFLSELNVEFRSVLGNNFEIQGRIIVAGEFARKFPRWLTFVAKYAKTRWREHGLCGLGGPE
jgi:hypothetical protein